MNCKHLFGFFGSTFMIVSKKNKDAIIKKVAKLINTMQFTKTIIIKVKE